jgi:hypothetical protein
MADEIYNELYGKEGTEAAFGYEPMPEAAPASDDTTFGGDTEALTEAAADLTRKREESEEAPVIPIEYKQIGGKHDGETSPENQTVELDRAATSLRNLHNVARTVPNSKRATGADGPKVQKVPCFIW